MTLLLLLTSIRKTILSQLLFRRRGIAIACLMTALPAASLQAHHLGSGQQLSCDSTFPCEEEIIGRVQFWVDVFSKWSNDQIILHDKNRPERVYAVIKTTASCTDKRTKKTVDRHRRKVATDLRTLAKRVAAGDTVYSDDEQHYLKLFPSRSANRIKKSADSIRCQQGNKTRFTSALARFEQYRPLVEKTLADEGVPDDIKYLPFVESAYNPEAYSRVGAAGLWQIMPKTAVTLGLSLNATIDERLDPAAATRGAAIYLSRSRKTLSAEARKQGLSITDAKLNPFVITSYNYGVSGMRRAVRAHGLDFIEVLNKYKSRSFRTAVKNFYASFLAARHVAKNPDQYFGDIETRPLYQHRSVRLQHATSLERIETVFGLSESVLKPLNPALTRFIWHRWRFLPAGYSLRLPADGRDWSDQIAHFQSLKAEEEAHAGSTYRVRRGDTACGVARAFRVRCRDLVDANQLGRKAIIRVGQKLTIPGSVKAKSRKSDKTQTAKSGSAALPATYKVRRGDTPCGISRKLGVQCQQLMRANRIAGRDVIRPGQMLKVPGGSAATGTASAASSLPATVRVKRGDTVCAIASSLGVSCKGLMQANNISSRGLIRIGQQLSVPGGGRADDSAAETQVAAGEPVTVTVVKGDTPCAIASRASISCSRLMKLNNIGKRGVIRPGQKLKLPGDAVPKSAPPVSVKVKSGDTPCGIARRHGVDCSRFMSINGLNKGAIIRVGQKLRLSADSTGADSSTDESSDAAGVASNAPAAPAAPSVSPTDAPAVSDSASQTMGPLDERLDLSVRVSDSSSNTYSVRVEPEETIGHYADWLDGGFAGSIRRLNGLGRNATVLVGQRIALPIENQAQLEDFQTKRVDYHRLLIEQFKEHFVIDKVENYRVKAGDSSWSIAENSDMPMWLLTRYNKSLRTKPPKLGETLKLPVIRAQ